jgi:hypothetical protein
MQEESQDSYEEIEENKEQEEEEQEEEEEDSSPFKSDSEQDSRFDDSRSSNDG